MVKLFIVCSKRNLHILEEVLKEGKLDKYELYLPYWYEDVKKPIECLKEDINNIKKCDMVLVIDEDLDLCTYSEIYEAYRNKKPIYTISKEIFHKNYKILIGALGIQSEYVENLDMLPYSKYINTDNNIQNLKGVGEELKTSARTLLNDMEFEPTVTYISRDCDIIFEWLSDPEKVDYCKYFVQLILYLDGSCNLKVMYYNEVVMDKISKDINYTVGKLNRYVHDFESLMR